ncbi:AraC family transcriptional regulator [Alcanivorax sp. DG881]|uniref:HTH araC/xylS-type domain-containing protein n=1 Tax=Alcanivorax hongdengensis TaxID=519051 RepID=G1C7P0_9GAMM|nr:AraC family transcriptional regulator [Alcanivorax sp. DG881]EDX89079.1 transcriptional regulator, AraC family protein [Alcanivorax sp. DG881]
MTTSPSPANSQASNPSHYARLIARELGLQAPDLGRLLPNTGLSVEQLLDEDSLLTGQQQVQLLNNALSISDDPAFGFRLGRRLTPATHGAVGFLALSSANLFEALQAIHLFAPTRMNFVRIELFDRGDWLECYGHFDMTLTDQMRRCLTEAFIMMFFETAESILGRPAHEVETLIDYPAPPYAPFYNEYLPGPYEFSAENFIAKIPKALCFYPNIAANHENYQLALQQCETMLSELRTNTQSFRYRVEKMMLSFPPGTLAEEEAAAALFMSKRTLARKLKNENTGFRQIQKDILSQQAANYLRDSKLTVDAIAALLNYHDSSNFRRAFKRWFSVTPETFRQSL